MIKDEDIIELHKDELTDKEIAKELGVKQSSVNYRRKRLGLENNYHKKEKKFDIDKFLELYHEGQTDVEIALKLGVTAPAVTYQREKRKLRSHYMTEREKRRMEEMVKKLSEKAMKVYKNLGNPLGVAQNQGFSVFAVANHNNILMTKIRPILLELEAAGLIRIEDKNENLKKAMVFRVR